MKLKSVKVSFLAECGNSFHILVLAGQENIYKKQEEEQELTKRSST